MRRRYTLYETADEAFVGQIQRAADWLAQRRVLPEPVKVGDFLA